MRALTMDEVGFVSGGDDGPVVVTAPRNPAVTPGWGVIYPDDLALSGMTIMDLISTGEFIFTGSGGGQTAQQREAQFRANTRIERTADGLVKVTFLRDVLISANVPTVGQTAALLQAGSVIVGEDRSGGRGGSANGIPDILDRALSYNGGLTWR